MKVNSIAVNYGQKCAPSFQRKLTKEEQKACANDIKRGLGTLDKSLGIILPTNCAPSRHGADIGIGVPYSESAKEIIPFLTGWGITKWQQEPSGMRKPTDSSPYVSNSSAYNTLLIDLESLTKSENGAILSKATSDEIYKNNPRQGQNKTSFSYSVNANKKALKEAWETFDYKRGCLEELEPAEKSAIESLNKEFQNFKNTHGREQEKNALYSILTDIYGNDYWPLWSNPTDRNLFDVSNSRHEQDAKESRLSELRREHKEDIDSFLFSQMLAKKTISENVEKLDKQGIKTIGDIPVAFSDAEVWGNKHLFSPTLRMGCQEPYSPHPQKWGFWVLDPDKMFTPSGKLGEAGKFLYDKYERAFEENKGGVRIDHILGLIDPYVYEEGSNKQGRLYSQLYKGRNGHKYDRILKEVILPAAQAAGLDSKAIIAEDLGYMPEYAKNALKDLGIGGISVTQWLDSGQVWNAPSGNVAMIGCHDTASAKEKYPDKNLRREKFAELFSSGAKNIQVFWTDLVGTKERYNTPGTVGDDNWALRLTPNFNDEYHNRLQEYDALNIPDAVLEANRRRDPNFYNNHGDLARSLEHWSNVLRERG